MRAHMLRRLAIVAAAVACAASASAVGAQEATSSRHPAGLVFSYGTSIGALRVWSREASGQSSSGYSVGNRFRLMLYPARGVGIGAEIRQDGRDFSSDRQIYISALTLIGQYHPASVLGVRHTYAQASIGSATDSHAGIEGGTLGLGVGGVRPVGHCGPRCRPQIALEGEVLRLYPGGAYDRWVDQLTVTGFGGVSRRF
jgi:hypothetical protein